MKFMVYLVLAFIARVLWLCIGRFVMRLWVSLSLCRLYNVHHVLSLPLSFFFFLLFTLPADSWLME